MGQLRNNQVGLKAQPQQIGMIGPGLPGLRAIWFDDYGQALDQDAGVPDAIG
tara:strand:+ start:94 stop:249 length:156 start_codon:yes stop_codon:yes gene_type:complete